MRHGGQFVAVVVLIASCSARSAVPVGSETGEDSGTSESGDIDDTWEADLPVGVDLPPQGGDPCDSDADCPAGLDCIPFEIDEFGGFEWDYVCTVPGSVAEGEACELTQADMVEFTNPCEAGTVCNFGRCSQICDGSCPTGEECLAALLPSFENVDVCRVQCADDWATCPGQSRCVVYSIPGAGQTPPSNALFRLGCVEDGIFDIPEVGVACDSWGACVDGVCLASNPKEVERECRATCELASPSCPGGTVCTPLDSWFPIFVEDSPPGWDGVCL